MKVRHLVFIVAIPAILICAYYAWGNYSTNITFDRELVLNEQVLAAATEAQEIEKAKEKALEEIAPGINAKDLLPDLLPLPAADLKIERAEDGKVLLYFSTTYYNKGLGTMELIADPKTAGIKSDIERNVLQRVYRSGGGYRDAVVGTFLWHQEHLHYHFKDFIEYDLEAIDAPGHEDLSGSRSKSTFCLRDISKVDLELTNREGEAVYTVCGKEHQGISVGWGDTYYYTYPAQNLDISELKSGIYRFTQTVNPENNLEELRYQNNVSVAVFRIDMEKLAVEVIETTPKKFPNIEHIRLDDPFGL